MTQAGSATQRTILLATDLSARSDRALDRAAQLARQRNAKLVVLHVVEPSFTEQLTSPSWRRVSPDFRALAERRVRNALSDVNLDFEVVVEIGHPVEKIRKVADAYNAELIVAGVARDETLGRLLLGTTVEKLARESERPILIVKERAHGAYQKIVLATDFSEGSRQALSAAVALLPEAELKLLHAFVTPLGTASEQVVADFQHAAEKACGEFVAASPCLASHAAPAVQIEHGQPETKVPEYIFQHPGELLVVGTHGLTGLLRTAIGSVAERLIVQSPSDVLVIRQHKD